MQPAMAKDTLSDAPRTWAQIAAPEVQSTALPIVDDMANERVAFNLSDSLTQTFFASAHVSSDRSEMSSTKDSACAQANLQPSQTNTVTSSRRSCTPTAEFRFFPDLPAELRIKIWGFAAHASRIIELEYDEHTHSGYNTSLASRRVPAILHTSSEARIEGSKFYCFRNFEDNDRHPIIPIYYNPNADILLFSPYSCITSIYKYFVNQGHQPIPRVAFMLGPGPDQEMTCCTMRHPITNRLRRIPILQALHGFTRVNSDNSFKRLGGCYGLREVFFVVESSLCRAKLGELAGIASFRPATSLGISPAQNTLHRRIQASIAQLENGLSGEGDYWQGTDKPEFKFVSFTPHVTGPAVHDGLTVGCDDIPKLVHKHRAFLRRLERETFCEIKIFKEEYPRQNPREISFYGEKAAINATKTAIMKLLRVDHDTNLSKWLEHYVTPPAEREPYVDLYQM